MSETTDRDDEVAKAMETAQQTCEAMSAAFGEWMSSQLDGTVPIVGSGTGVSKLAGLILGHINDERARDAAVTGAVATLLVNSGCNVAEVLENVGCALQAHALATVKEAGHA